MAWLLTGNYTIAGGLDRCFFVSLLGDCESGTIIDLLTPPMISGKPQLFSGANPHPPVCWIAHMGMGLHLLLPARVK
jgi:hypothetical protein